MRKSVFATAALALFLAIVRSSEAGTSATTTEFLKKLNGCYYCLSAEGLKGYHCDVSCSPGTAPAGSNDKLWAAVKGLRFTVDDSTTDATSVQGSAAPATGDAQLDARIGKLQETILQTLKSFLQYWKSFVMEPLNDPSDMEKNDLKFKRTDQGFTVTQTDPSGGIFAASFDKKGKALECSIQEGGSNTVVQPQFVNTQKGYLLTEMLFKGPDTNQQFKVGYGIVDRYWMPKDLSVKVNLPDSSDIEIHFQFSNYRVNQ